MRIEAARVGGVKGGNHRFSSRVERKVRGSSSYVLLSGVPRKQPTFAFRILLHSELPQLPSKFGARRTRLRGLQEIYATESAETNFSGELSERERERKANRGSRFEEEEEEE